MIANGGFESSFRRDNPWPGVNQAGFLEGLRGSVPVLTQSGVIADTSMPVSVSVADMNGDNKPDLVMSDVIGYLRVYFNVGTPEEPKFGGAEMIPVFLTRTPWFGTRFPELYKFQAQRITVGDFARTGKNDILIGNYLGQILWVKNQGSISAPDFRQPKTPESIWIPTTKDSQQRWGNVFAPAAWDWNKDGKFDLLLGEGSYSANSIHLLLNQGTGGSPRFDEDNRHFLAFGDGREQLTPNVVDYNGDGNPDLLVADRSGKIGLFLNPGATWKPGDEIPFTSYVPIQGQAGRDLTFGGICTVSTGDLNNDGLFDLVVGKTNGRIAVAYNRGTKTEPKFDTPIEIKGETKVAPLQLPSGWDVDYGMTKGNYFGYITAVSLDEDPQLAPPEGKKALKFAYLPNSNQVIRSPLTYLPALTATAWSSKSPGMPHITINGPANYFAIRQDSRLKFTPEKSYVLTFKTKGKNVSDAKVEITYNGIKKMGEMKVERGDRGAATAVDRNEIREIRSENIPFSPGGSWTQVTKEFKVLFANKELNDQPAGGYIIIAGALAPGTGELWLDDVQVMEKK